MKPWYLYIIETTDNTLYTGITNNIEKRWAMHVQGKGAKYLRAHKPKAVVYHEQHVDRSAASQREAAVKKMTRQQKLKLIALKK